LDTLTASGVLRRLRDRRLLIKQGSGSRTYYTLESMEDRSVTPSAPGAWLLEAADAEDHGTRPTCGDPPNPHKLGPESTQVLVGIPDALWERIQAAGQKPRQAILRGFLLELCALRPFSADELCQILGRSDPRELTRGHLKPMREIGQLALLYPESAKHPHQAYVVPGSYSEAGYD
jgi:ATP-dependent DNA helicase RecG